jgi:hypothetical protein
MGPAEIACTSRKQIIISQEMNNNGEHILS